MANGLYGVVRAPLGGRDEARPPGAPGAITMIMDKGLGLRATVDLIEVAAPYIDYWKLPFGSALLYPERRLREKVSVIRAAGIVVYPGGTALEIAIEQGRLEAFYDWAEALGMNGVEVSDGTITLHPALRREAIEIAARRGLHVVTEVGKKVRGSRFDPVAFWRQVADDRLAGARHVIVEGRESGRGVGIYDDDGAIDPEALGRLVEGAEDPAGLIWEAPDKEQQVAIIERFGPRVGIGNVPPGEVLALECLRQGLRADTFRWTLPAPPPGVR
jgi:phosphosulfolactate synthase